MLTRLGESGTDAFTIMRVADHSSIVVSQRYIHPTPESVERAFRGAATVRGFRAKPAKTSATRFNIRYARADGIRKLLKGL